MRKNKIFKIVFLGLIILLGLALIGLEVSARLYRNKAGVYFREAFTQQSDLVLQPFQTSISVWRHFPNITFNFKNISLLDTSGTVPLQVMFVKEAQLTVPMSQYRLHHIRIKSIILDNVLYRLHVDSTGKNSTVLFRQISNPDTLANKISFNIPEITIRNGKIISQNKFKKTAFALQIEQAELTARLVNQQLNLEGQAKGKIDSINSPQLSFFKALPYTTNIHYRYDINQKKGTIYNTNAIVNNNKINIGGSHTKLTTNVGSRLDFKLTGYQPLSYLLKQLLPVRGQSYLSRVRTNSRLHFICHISGESSPRQRPRNQISFNLKNGDFYLPASKNHIRQVQLRGDLDNGAQHSLQTSTLRIVNLSGLSGQDSVQVQLQVKDFTHPAFTFQGQGRLNLPALFELVSLPVASVSQGSVVGKFGLSGHIPDTLQNASPDWVGQGNIRIEQAAFKPVGLSVSCNAVNGNLYFTNNLMQLQNLNGMLGGQPFKIEASVQNYFAYLFQQPGLTVAKASINLNQFNTDWLEKNLMAVNNNGLPSGRRPAPVAATSTPTIIPVKLAHRISAKELGAQQSDEPTFKLIRSSKVTPTAPQAKNWWQQVRLQANLKVAHINLPNQEKIHNLLVQVNQNGKQVKLTSMRFDTHGGGSARANGGFSLTKAGIWYPHLNVSLQYPALNLQTFMLDIASLKREPASRQLAATKPGKQKQSYFKENDYLLNLQIKAKQLQYLYLKGSNLLLVASLNQNRARVTNLRLQAFGGTINARGDMQLNAPTDVFPVRLRAQLNNINLQQLFAIADNMQMDVLSSQNIKGTAAFNLNVSTQLDRTFSPSFVGTVSYAKATFRNLELIQVAPIQEALRFLRRERTQHLYFEDVATNFLQKDNLFITPGLSMNSNLTSFDLSGTYTMGGAANLNMDINVLNVLFGNNKRRIERIQSDSLSVVGNQKKQHLLLRREQNKYKVRLHSRKDRAASAVALKKQFQEFIMQHQIDTVFTLNEK